MALRNLEPTLAPRAIIDGATVTFHSTREKFDALTEAWDDRNGGSSVLILNDILYQQIIGMGRETIPFLLERLRKGEGHWIHALKCISGEQAETAEMHGNADAVIDAWLDWGRARGVGIGQVGIDARAISTELIESLSRVYLWILRFGLTAGRDAGLSGNLVRCTAEFEHLHNLPSLIGETNVHRHLYYIGAERTMYLESVVGSKQTEWMEFVELAYLPLWKELEEILGVDKSRITDAL